LPPTHAPTPTTQPAFSIPQDIMVFDSATYGRVLILDGVIQLTERDEFAYQEMIAHLPMFAHPNPQNVLIVGGGDGGVLREVCRHKGVKRVVMCEIDQRVVEVSKQFFGTTMATAYSDPRATVHYMDAAVYMKDHKNEFDVIIVDSSDPVGPAETLYTSAFYQDMYGALREGGVVCTQGECQYLHLELIRKVMEDAKALYPVVDYAYSCVPTYPDGQIGYIIATKAKGGDVLRTPKRPVPEDMRQSLRYYNEQIHEAAFVLPQFAAKKLEGVRAPQNNGSGGPRLFGGAGFGLAALSVGLGVAAGFFIAAARRR
jgi:spermidine synthase